MGKGDRDRKGDRKYRRTAIQIGCEALGYTRVKVVVDDEKEREERELSDEEIYERRIEALRMLEGRDEDKMLGCKGEEMLLRPVAYRA